MRTTRSGYDGRMTENQKQPGDDPLAGNKDLAEHERPDVGLVGDEDLPEDLRPTDDNPLAQDPDDGGDADRGESARKVEGMPDMGDPGTPA